MALSQPTAPLTGAAQAVPTATTPPPAGREPRSYLPFLGVANLGVYMALLTPVMVSMAFKIDHLVGADAAPAALGTVMGVGALFALICNPLAGRLSDRTTSRLGMRRPWIVGGAIVGAAALVVVGTAQSVALVLVGWCVAQAAFNAVLAAANATIPDQVPVERRGKVSGLVGMATPLAILLGSVIVNQISADAARFIVPAALGLIFSLLFAAVLHDRTLDQAPAQRFTVGQFFGSFVFDPRKHPDFGWTWLTKFMVMFGYAGIATFLPYYLVGKFDLSEQEATGVILTATFASVVGMVISSPVGGILSDRFGKRRPFVAAAGAIMAVGLVILAFAPTIALVVLGQAIIGLGAGAFFSVDIALATQVLPNKDDTAKDLGVLNIANALPQSLAPAMAPAILAVGATLPMGEYPTWYLFGAVVALAGAVLVYRIKGVR